MFGTFIFWYFEKFWQNFEQLYLPIICMFYTNTNSKLIVFLIAVSCIIFTLFQIIPTWNHSIRISRLYPSLHWWKYIPIVPLSTTFSWHISSHRPDQSQRTIKIKIHSRIKSHRQSFIIRFRVPTRIPIK